MSSPSIVWFRRDLRIQDNPALSAAAREGCVLPVFIWCPKEDGQFCPGRVSRWWLKQSLIHLNKSLTSLGSPLLFIKAESTLLALLQCVHATGSTKVVFNHLYDPVSLVRDHNIKRELAELGIIAQTFNSDILFEPWEVYDGNGHAFTIFNAFWKKCMSMPLDIKSYLPPWQLIPPAGSKDVESSSIEELGLENEMEKSSNALLSKAWSPGWSNGDKILNEFIEGHLVHYSRNRMKLGGTTTSLLSPYLHFGEVSVRKIYQSVRMKQIEWAKEGTPHAEESVIYFLRSIGLREYSRYLCFNFPFTHERSLLGNLIYYPWRHDEVHFKIWRQGKTGYPLVDAGMRELWATGWVHNRTRVIVASFLVKFLLLPWTWGMKYFWDTLLDADLESDILGWQYISGSLPDGHELNHLDSPEFQGRMFDPEGQYVRQWLPELARMPTEWIHHPWDAPISVLTAAGVDLGLNYPRPIIDIDTAKERLDYAVTTMWESDRAARAGKIDGSDEVVADNLISINEPVIPKVVVKKEFTCASSSQDQKVPSMIYPKHNLYGPTEMQNLDSGTSKQDKIRSNISGNENLEKDRDLQSTADSCSSKKRSIAESHAVPMLSLSSSSSLVSQHKQPGGHGQSRSVYFSYGSISKRPLLEDLDSQGKREDKEGDADAQSAAEGMRPCKRPT